MSKPSVMRQDHGVAISFNASATSGGGRNIFCWFYFVYVELRDFVPILRLVYI